MITREVQDTEKTEYNKLVQHPLQSWEWGEFRESFGQKVIRLGVFDEKKMVSGYQVVFSTIPKIGLTIGTLLKGPRPDELMINSLRKLGKEQGAIFIKMEPLVLGPDQKTQDFLINQGCLPGKPLFTKNTFWVDLTKTEEQLLTEMHPKTRYNLRLAQKNGVIVEEDNSPEAFSAFLKLHFETTERESFFSHNPAYHQNLWNIFQPVGMAHLLIAKYKNQPLVSWMLFEFNHCLYYPYGGSSRDHKELMPSYLMMWEAIRFGKQRGCQTFDLWGALGENPDPKDPWFGFHRFKQGFNPRLVEFIGSYDLIINPPFYKLYILADKVRWLILRNVTKIKQLL
jgi:lipid II:glycine glycyltransferase (peptidoglycan interpeptide bridge formation enzyme)